MIGIFTLPLAANESREVAISGEYFELRNAIFPVTLIELLDRSGGVVSRMDNPEESDFVKPGRYETIRITNGPNAQTVKHFYGSGDAGSRRTSGNVSVVDGNKARTLANLAFIATAYSSALAANFSMAQLWNPVGSGKNLIVESLILGSTTAGSIGVRSNNAALTTPGVVPASKKFGGAVGVGLTNNQQNAAQQGTQIYAIFSAASTSIEKRFIEPIVLPPGWGLHASSSALNQDVSATFEYFEEPA